MLRLAKVKVNGAGAHRFEVEVDAAIPALNQVILRQINTADVEFSRAMARLLQCFG